MKHKPLSPEWRTGLSPEKAQRYAEWRDILHKKQVEYGLTLQTIHVLECMDEVWLKKVRENGKKKRGL